MNNATSRTSLVQSLWITATQITLLDGFLPSPHRLQCIHMTRRVKLMLPFLEELKESEASPQELSFALYNLERTLHSALHLLQFCRNGSKLYLVFRSRSIVKRFQSVTENMEKALDRIICEAAIGFPQDVKEQIELVHTQLKRTNRRIDLDDMEPYVVNMLAMSQMDDTTALRQLANKLQLETASQLKAEAQALQTLVKEKAGKRDESMKQILILLKKLNLLIDETDNGFRVWDLQKLSVYEAMDDDNDDECIEFGSIVPNDFRCPISLELMRDPVVIATGQTYERSSIEKWLEGHKTCPKTGEVLSHSVLTPNIAVRNLITKWCEASRIEVPQTVALNHGCRPSLGLYSSKDARTLDVLIQHLRSGQIELQKAAAAELRSLAKQDPDNRVYIAEAGAIPHLVNLLSTEDYPTQGHAVTALLNLSIHHSNKTAIVRAGAVPHIVRCLRRGSMETKENAAATLFSLSIMDENKMIIGASEAIPPLIDLLRDGSYQGRKDAAIALLNLVIYQGNKSRAIRGGIITPLMKFIVDPTLGLTDEAIAILAILVTHKEGSMAVANAASGLPALVDLLQNGSSRNKENAASVLLALSASHPNRLINIAQELHIKGSLIELFQSGTARARRKARSLLEWLNKQNRCQGRSAIYIHTHNTRYYTTLNSIQ